MAGRDTLPYWQAFRVRTGQGMAEFEPPPLPATERVGPGIWISVGTECLLSCDAITLV